MNPWDIAAIAFCAGWCSACGGITFVALAETLRLHQKKFCDSPCEETKGEG